MDGQVLCGHNRSSLIDRFSNDIHNSSERLGADGHHDGVACVADLLASDQTLGGVHSNRSHVVSTQVLGDFENESVVDTVDLKGVEDGREVALELDVDDSSNNLRDFTHSSDLGSTEALYKTMVST